MSRYSTTTKSLLKDGSWIRRDDDEDEDIDRDPNFARSVLGRYKPTGTGDSEDGGEVKTTTTTSSSVQAISRRFSGSQDETKSSTLPSSKTTSTYTRKSVTDEPKSSTMTTSVTKDGKTTETTTITTSQTLRSSDIRSATTFTERVKSSSKAPMYSTYSPSSRTKVTETVSTNKGAEDKLFDTLLPSGIRGDHSPTDRSYTTTETVTVRSSSDTKAEDKLYDSLRSLKDDDSKTTVTSTETVNVKSSPIGDSKTTTTTPRTSTAEDNLYDTLLPKSITSALSPPARTSSITRSEVVTVESSRGGDISPSSTRTSSYSVFSDDAPTSRSSTYTVSTKPGDEYNSDRRSYSYSRPSDSSYEYSSSSTTYRTSSRSDERDGDSIYKTSSKNVYGSSDRIVHEKDLCSICHKPFTGDAKMVLDDMRINCHATCFKCEVCNYNMGHMKAGDNMWIYKRMVHCENCFEVTREKWRM